MVKSLLSLLSNRQTSILSGATILMITVLASKFLGLVRDRLLAQTFAPDQVAVFLAAFRIPDLIFQLLVFGAVSVAFIPVFTDYLEHKGEKQAFGFAADVLNLVLVVFALVCLGIFFLASPLTNLIVPGFTPAQKELTAQLTQIIVFGQILLVVGSFFASICQSFQRFVIPALASIFYNLGIILGIIFLVPFWGIAGPAVGVIIGAFFYVIVQIPLVNSLGFRPKLSFNLFSEGVKEVLSLMSIRTVGVAVEQVNETVGIILASLISASSVTFLTFAQHLQTVPIGLFGATLAQAALPVLAQERSKGEGVLFKSTLLTTMHQILFLTLPVAAILIVLRIPAVRLVFGASQFNWEATVLTGKTVAFLSVGLAAQSVVLLLVRGFYALKDTRTPVIVSVISVLVNIALSTTLVTQFHLPIWSLGFSYSLVTVASALMLLFALSHKLGGFPFTDLYLPAIKMIVSAGVAAVALYIPIKALDQLVFDTTKTINLLFLTGIASTFGLGVYLLLVWLFRVKELETFSNLLKNIWQRRLKTKTAPELVKETGTV